MPRPNRIRRTLAIRVSERRRADGVDENSPGQRFATGWAHFCNNGQFTGDGDLTGLSGDPIAIAGYLAAKAAWDAHYHATNWVEVA